MSNKLIKTKTKKSEPDFVHEWKCRECGLEQSFNMITPRDNDIVNELYKINPEDMIKHLEYLKNKKVKSIDDIKEICSIFEGADIGIMSNTRVDFGINQRCSNCGAEYLRDVLLSRDEIIKRGYELYEDFKIFMGSESKNLPDRIKIISFDYVDNSLTVGGMVTYNEDEKIFVINISTRLSITDSNINSVFYHEFAHIYQDYDPVTGGKKQESKCLYPLTSEYLASEIEMMKLLGFKNYNEIKEIEITDCVYDMGQTLTVKEYLEKDLDSKVYEINYLFENSKNHAGMISLMRCMVYFRAKLNFCIKHMNEQSAEILIPYRNILSDLLLSKLEGDVKEQVSLPIKSFDDFIVGTFRDIDVYILEMIINNTMYLLFNDMKTNGKLKMDKALAEDILNKVENGLLVLSFPMIVNSIIKAGGNQLDYFYMDDNNNPCFNSALFKKHFIDGGE